ncbi:MAG: acyl carrier protein [Bacteroidetes bacterium]|nr:acyl carrier protein [Bacteroidota bacterium]MBL7104678.1 acyl carrier protein [Bacteroidales bacterium]
MEKGKIVNIIDNFLVEELEIEEDLVSPSANLKSDLGIESLDFVDIAVIIEKEFGFKIRGEEMVDVKTLQNLYDYLYVNINENK